ncbi:MAG TPA: hypothetical protein PKU80_10925 [Candidatus Limiplasma sp.]|nr:hypothetical protein [Candidatus Limiplasma sp.]
MKKSLKTLLVAIMILAIIVLVLLGSFFIISTAARQITMNKTINIFSQNRNAFAETLKLDIPLPNENQIADYTISQELMEFGIDKVFLYKENTYFEFKNRILGLVPFGILYVQNLSAIQEWYRLNHIDGNWYYYRIAP